jgi:hypothetical protein
VRTKKHKKHKKIMTIYNGTIYISVVIHKLSSQLTGNTILVPLTAFMSRSLNALCEIRTFFIKLKLSVLNMYTIITLLRTLMMTELTRESVCIGPEDVSEDWDAREPWTPTAPNTEVDSIASYNAAVDRLEALRGEFTCALAVPMTAVEVHAYLLQIHDSIHPYMASCNVWGKLLAFIKRHVNGCHQNLQYPTRSLYTCGLCREGCKYKVLPENASWVIAALRELIRGDWRLR